MDWVYGQAIGFLGNFFALMGNMGVELFELEWVSAIILFVSRLAWALFTVSVVVCAFECGIEYSTGRGNLQQCGMNIIKGFLAASLSLSGSMLCRCRCREPFPRDLPATGGALAKWVRTSSRSSRRSRRLRMW